MAQNVSSFSDSFKAKEMSYPDNFFTLAAEKVNTFDSFSFNSYAAFKDINDIKSNNYSNLFLSKKRQNSEWLIPATKNNGTKPLGIVTTLSFFNNDPQTDNNKGAWLYFDKNYEFWDINLKTVPYLLTWNRPTSGYLNYVFYIDFIDERHCTIAHTFGDIVFYLSINEANTIEFVKEPKNDSHLFVYTLDGNKIRLYKKMQYEESGEKLFILTPSISSNGDATIALSENITDSKDAVIYVEDNILDFEFYCNASWVAYDRRSSVSSINRTRSAFELQSQALFHHEYNSEGGVNFIPLKNNLTYKGSTMRGSNLSVSPDEYPDVNFRNYTTINSGVNQEFGNDNIILNYLFFDQEYTVNDGEELFIFIGDANEETGYEPLFPYKFININDTKFVKNGAFASSVPYFADKFKRLTTMHTRLDNVNGNRAIANNGTYLCTWLYQANADSKPIWLDRYYFPDRILRKRVYQTDTQRAWFAPLFNNDISKNYLDNATEFGGLTGDDSPLAISHYNAVYDKVSDLVIEPSNTYKFTHVSKELVDAVVRQLDGNRISDAKDNNGNVVSIEDSIRFDSEKYRRIDHKAFGKTNSITFNADIYINPKKQIGLQLFGSDYTAGFNIQNRKDLVPFHYYATDTTLYLLNNEFEIKREFNLYEKYQDNIVKFILGDVFDDVVLVSGIHLYILSYDLKLKTRVTLVNDSTLTDDEAIQGLNDLGLTWRGEPVSLVNYPYSNRGKNITIPERETSKTIAYSPANFTKNVEESSTSTSRTIKLDKVGGSVLLPSNISRIICEQNSVLYKNNLYIPFNQSIIKIIFNPDSKYDDFTERDTYVAKARILNDDEYSVNYLKKNNLYGQTEEETTENGFIEVESIIKNIHIDTEGRIYALNYDNFGVSPDGDTVYGLYAAQKYINSGGWFWLFNQSMGKMQANVATSKYAEFASPNSIDLIKFNKYGEMALVRNFHNIAENTDRENDKRLEIFDKTKKRIRTVSLEEYDEILSMDSYTYIDSEFTEKTVFTLLAKNNTGITRLEYVSETGIFEEFATELPAENNERFYETVNSNSLMRNPNENALFFNLFFPTEYIYDRVATIKWVLNDIQEGWYNINASVNLDTAVFEVHVNDTLLGRIDSESDSWFEPHVNSNGTIFDTSYYLGTLGKKYGTTLNNILNNQKYDPYNCKNSEMENIRIFNKSLEYYEYQAMRMEGKPINPISLTLPCGARNNIEEIVRFFKYNPPAAISNKVKINISGAGLTTTGEFEILKKQILTALEEQTDCLVKVENIEFI